MSKNFRLLSNAWNNTSNRSISARFGLILFTLVFVFSLVGMTPTSVLAAAPVTYYVNKTITCSDANPGTSPAAPFCTITRGATVARFGDTVQVVAGSYAETVNPSFSGIAGSPITYSALSGVIVTGNGTATGSAFRITSQNYIVINGFTIQNTTENGIYLATTTYVTVSNNTVSNTFSNGIYVDGSDHATVSDNVISHAGNNVASTVGNGIYLKNTTLSTVDGNTAYQNWDGIRLSASSNNTVSDNVTYNNVDGNKGNGIAMLALSNANSILHNISYANRDSGLQFEASSNNYVTGNLSYHNGDHGIDTTSSAIGHMIVGNTNSGKPHFWYKPRGKFDRVDSRQQRHC